MISVVIPTQNCEAPLALTLAALVPAAAEGLISEVVLVDGGSDDGTELVADAAGARFLTLTGSIGTRLSFGAKAVRRGEWLLFLQPGAVLASDWAAEVERMLERLQRNGLLHQRAAVFTLECEEQNVSAWMREFFARWRCRILGIPYAEQGLLISRAFYEEIGGHSAVEVMEDADLAGRIGRRRLIFLRSGAADLSGRTEACGLILTGRRFAARFAVAAFKLSPLKLRWLYGSAAQTHSYPKGRVDS